MKKIKNIWSVLVWIYMLLSIISLILLKNTIESYAREQARQIANWIWQCIKSQVKWNEDRTELSKISYQCWQAHRSWWPTWDFFVVDLTTKQFIYDWSPDCSKEWYDRHLTDKEECSLHQNKDLCYSVIKQLKLWFNSTENTKLYWEFDNAPEWLEWKIIPWEREWFDWPIWFNWLKNINNKQLLVVMWTQSDEVNSFWLWLKTIYSLSIFLGVFLVIFSYLIVQYDRKNN